MFGKLKILISEKLGVEVEDITIKSSFSEDLDADSITFFDLIMAIEDEFDIEVDDESIEGIVTVGDLVKYIREYNYDNFEDEEEDEE
jgi:acyl carrier protein